MNGFAARLEVSIGLLAALLASIPVVFQRLTVTPLSFFATKFLSRSAFMCAAMRV